MTPQEINKYIDDADEGLLTPQQMIALIRELAVYGRGTASGTCGA
jgi:hypothetical protein